MAASAPSQPSTAPLADAPRGVGRKRLSVRAELLLALLPTATVLGVLALVEVYSHQRLLFASLASSAFLIYLDPEHATNSGRTLLLSQCTAAVAGFGFYAWLGPGYLPAALAMLTVIGLMVVLDAVHPPAVSTALSFAFQGQKADNLLLFGAAVGLILLLVALQRGSVWLLRRLTRTSSAAAAALTQPQ